MDVQGAELPFIESMGQAVEGRKVRFMVISTHHEAISGSDTTHEDCVRSLRALGATVLVEHDVFESYSGDGLIVASFAPEDRSIVLPEVSRNVRERSFFSGWIARPPVAVPVAIATVPAPPQGWLRRQVMKLARSYRKRFKAGAARRVA